MIRNSQTVEANAQMQPLYYHSSTPNATNTFGNTYIAPPAPVTFGRPETRTSTVYMPPNQEVYRTTYANSTQPIYASNTQPIYAGNYAPAIAQGSMVQGSAYRGG